ncbi:MAG: GAF domain-containing protein [Prochlorothrix sp.]|nr:GAF domain-containing protein [Prochlorothrix sp.]
MLQQLREGTDPIGLWETAFAYIQQQVEYQLVWILRYDRANHCLQGQGGHGPNLSEPDFLRERVKLKSGDLLEQLMIQPRSLIVPNLCEEPKAGRLSSVAQKVGVQGALLFPVHRQNTCYGLIIFGSERWGILVRPEEKALLNIVLGQLAISLYEQDRQQQHKQTERPEKVILEMIQGLSQRTSQSERSQWVLESSQAYLQTTSMGIYGYEAEGRYFYPQSFSPDSTQSPTQGGTRRTGRSGARSQAQADTDSRAPRLAVQTIPKLYSALASNTSVTIGTTQSSLPTESTRTILGYCQGRSLLLAPLLSHGQLLGFLAAIQAKARLWSEEEKEFLQGAAQLLALTYPLTQVEVERDRQQQRQDLLAEVGRAVRSDRSWQQLLKDAAPQILNYFQVDRIVLMVYAADEDNFAVAFQFQREKQKKAPDYWAGLSEVDLRLLEDDIQGVALENVEDDLRLLAWRDLLLGLGVQSLTVCRTTVDLPLEGVLLLGHNTPRTWSPSDRHFLQSIAQNLGQALHQWVLQQDLEQQQRLYQTLQWGFSSIQQTTDAESLEQTVTELIGQTLQAPLATLITWKPRRPLGRFAAIACTNPAFALAEGFQVPLNDVLIEQVLGYDGVMVLSVDQLTADTRQWLTPIKLDRVMAMALRTRPEEDPLGIMLVADSFGPFWSEGLLSLVGALINQLAWVRRDLLLVQRLHKNQTRMRQLNWYKHFRFVELRRQLESAQAHLNQALQATQKNPQATPPALLQRYQQAGHGISQSLSDVLQVIRHEQWQLQFYQRSISLASFLKRALGRIDPLVKQRRLWVQIHANDSAVELAGDIVKLESVLYQVLIFGSQRSPEQGRIDIWCQLLDETTLDISLTDNGHIEASLLLELQQGRHSDALAPSSLDQPPGLVLAVCQTLLSDMGGSLEFYALEDGRTMSRLVLPFISVRSR